jgi:peptidoglycan hydrolase-like protein with peptidoglycan-binding domain
MGTRSRRLISTTLLAIATVVGSALIGLSQDRPRYSSSQYADREWTVPEGTVISMRMDRTLSSRTSRVGDRFTGTVTIPVHVNGRTVIPAGSIIEGRVTEVTPAKRMSKSGTIAIDFDELILPNGFRARLVGSLTSEDPEAQKRIDEEGQVSGDKRDKAVFVGGGGAIGAVLGGIAGGGKGAILGGIAGAGVGVAGVLLSKGEEAEVPTGTPFGVQLRQPLVISNDPNARDLPVDSDSADPSIAPDARERSPERRDRVDEGPVDTPPPTERRSRRRDRADDPTADPGPPAESRDRKRDSEGAGDPDGAPDSSDPATESAPPPGPPLPLSSPEMIRRAQTALKDQGYYEGGIDGQMTPRTSTALRTFQRERHLPETGNLDDATAKALGILSAVNPDDRRSGRTQSRDTGAVGRSAPARDSAAGEPPAGASDAVLANVVSAIANRDPDGAITVVINTQANTGGWRWFGDHVVNGDTLEVYARGIRPAGISTQILTRGRIELNINEGVDYVRRLVVHSAGGDLNVLIRNTGGSSRDSATARDSGPARDSAPRRDSGPARDTTPVRETSPPVRDSAATPAPVSIQRKAEDLLAEYQRLVGVRLTGTGLEFESRATRDEDEIELLFALDSFANASQLYARLLPSLRDNQSLRSAALALSREARRSDRLFSTSSSRAANTLTARWDSIRQDILKLMQNHRISSTDLDF